MSSAKDIDDRAALWLLHREQSDWSEQDQAGLDAWLAESTLHRIAFYRLEYGWRKADRLAALKSPAPAPALSRPGLWRRVRMATAATSLAASLACAAWFLLGDPTADSRTYMTEIGARTSVPLEDSSQVELNTDSRLRTEFSSRARAAWLQKGEAYFSISRDESRPFVIHAGKQRVTVLGTKFSVRLDDDRVTVTVLEGRVEVSPESGGGAPAVATPGDILVARGEVTSIEHGSLDRVNAALGWRQGLLIFDRATVAEIASEFNRYNRKKLVVDGSAATAIHIGGTFDAGNVDAFVRLLRQAYHLTVDNSGMVIKVSGGVSGGQRPSQ